MEHGADVWSTVHCVGAAVAKQASNAPGYLPSARSRWSPSSKARKARRGRKPFPCLGTASGRRYGIATDDIILTRGGPTSPILIAVACHGAKNASHRSPGSARYCPPSIALFENKVSTQPTVVSATGFKPHVAPGSTQDRKAAAGVPIPRPGLLGSEEQECGAQYREWLVTSADGLLEAACRYDLGLLGKRLDTAAAVLPKGRTPPQRCGHKCRGSLHSRTTLEDSETCPRCNTLCGPAPPGEGA